MPPIPSPEPSFETLRDLLQAAATLAVDLATDPQVARLLTVFGRLPADDRETILGVLEREADAKQVVDATVEHTGFFLRPNPNARLYLRVIEPEGKHEPGHLEPDKIMVASVRAIRMMRKVITPMFERWRGATLDALGSLDADERADVVWFSRELLTLVEETERSR